MPFRFPLAAVLLIRENAEQREERALKKIQLDLARTSRELQELESQISAANDARDRVMQQPVHAFELHEYLRQLEVAAEKKKAVLQQLNELRADLDRQMKLYQAAHRDREALTDMLQKQKTAYEQDQAREQQKQLDDIFVARRHRS